MSLLLLMALLAVDANRDARGAWSVGYAVAIERACPGWRRRAPAELAQRGILGTSSATRWGPDGPLADAYWRGLEQAERDRRARGLCRPARWPELVRDVLTPGTTPPPKD